ncbi:MAG: Coq4 family protein, partial [Proteobacteria bacterium]|nr:Coq4 family protein [Pseudomonadota bacterium]
MSNPYEIRVGEAVSAMGRLLKDPEQTQEVFTIVRALSGKSILRGHNRFTRTSMGKQIIDEQRNLLTVLNDRDYLAGLPAGSLGRAYLEFVIANNITADGLVEASEVQADPIAAEYSLYGSRLRDSHDLWHVVTGYNTDTSGEDCLLGFTYAQTRNPGIAFIAITGGFKLFREGRRGIFKALWEGFRAGRTAQWLPAADWETLLTRPLHDVRESLNVTLPVSYPRLSLAAAV